MGQAPNKFGQAREKLDDALHDKAFKLIQPYVDDDDGERLTPAKLRGLASWLNGIVDEHDKRIAEVNAAEVIDRLDRSASEALFSLIAATGDTAVLREAILHEAVRGQLIRYFNTK